MISKYFSLITGRASDGNGSRVQVRCSRRTKITFVTTGYMKLWVLRHPEALNTVTHVLLDEAQPAPATVNIFW